MEYAQLLARHDHPTQWESPPDFDYNAAASRFAAFVQDLSEAIGATVRSETGAEIQDASFHSQAFLPLPANRRAVIRFSKFGDMVTVGDDERVPASMMKLIVELITRHGYTYVPAIVLNAPYTGSNPGVTGISSWWIRYFDWV
jgi:hypothetical protein